ncbi:MULTISPECIES: hypothetical protein [Aeromonas]|uniref:Uncharacterized protein n=1 Tax=Aeromonas veronii TaxID=654 RepID=A0A4S5CNH7_AERVE|nr:MULTISPECIES: hypothetical protein [Aeromonas]THJ45068.1 hypothetical protein E8Q35_12870 [Aeromonas veronii]
MAKYRYGFYLFPKPDDATTNDLDDAEQKAKALMSANNGAPIAVWDDNDQTVTLFAGYETFKPI